MGSFNISGLDDLQRELRKLSQNAKALSGEHQVPYSELFCKSFLKEHCAFSSFDELLKAGGFEVNSPEDFEAIPDAAFDAHIAAVTDFANWEEMQTEAAQQYVSRKLFDS